MRDLHDELLNHKFNNHRNLIHWCKNLIAKSKAILKYLNTQAKKDRKYIPLFKQFHREKEQVVVSKDMILKIIEEYHSD